MKIYTGNLSKLSDKEVSEVIKWNNKILKTKSPSKRKKLKRKLKRKLHNIKNPRVRFFTLYALLLENDKYYVGLTARRDVRKRFNEHLDGTGAKWTKLHKPIKILEVRELGKITESEACKKENAMALEYIGLYGHEHTRGGKWCMVSQSAFDKCI